MTPDPKNRSEAINFKVPRPLLNRILRLCEEFSKLEGKLVTRSEACNRALEMWCEFHDPGGK